MIDHQTLEDAQERYELLDRLDARGLLNEPDLQNLFYEQKRVMNKLKRAKIEQQLKVIC